MPDILIIESPNKIKKLKGYTNKGTQILATVGHYKDLPDGDMGVDLESLEPEFVLLPGKEKVSSDIKKAAEGNRIYIGTDPDREGYAIGMHVYQDTKKKATEVYRVEIREITQKGVEEAFKNAVPFSDTNFNLYNAFLGRRVGDRFVGYLVSPAASRALNGKYSVGRVQSPAVRMIVEREREIRAFVSEPFWLVNVMLEKSNIKFKAFHVSGKMKDKAVAESLLAKIKNETAALATNIEEKVTRQSPKAPFTTPELQSTAGAQLKFAPDYVMKLAQALFEAGIITYHRTDSVRIADDFIGEIRNQISASYGPSFLPAVPRTYKSKASQAEAHEAIRPTAIHSFAECSPVVMREGLSEEHAKLYELIWKRTVASQMADALYNNTVISFDVAGEAFKAKGRFVKFEGFVKAYNDEEEIKAEKETAGGTEDRENEEQLLPKVDKGELVPKVGENIEDKKTKPKGRYSEGTLVKSLEKLGIGRPSTYASIIKAIKDRGYIEVTKRIIYPTQKGEEIVDYLLQYHAWAVDYDFTKQMEEALDGVESNGIDWKIFAREIKGRIAPVSNVSRKTNNNSGTENNSSGKKSNNSGAKGVSAKYIDNTPTEKQIAFAKKLSEENGVALGESVLKDRKNLALWIDDILKKKEKQREAKAAKREKRRAAMASPLSEKQLAVIYKNAPADVKIGVSSGDNAIGRRFLVDYFKKRNAG